MFREVADGHDELRRALLDVRDAVGGRVAGDGPRRVHEEDERGVDVMGVRPELAPLAVLVALKPAVHVRHDLSTQ